jgi:hypothetical protein
MALFAVGAICFLRTAIFHFAPHADLLPQLAAMATGLYLGQEVLPQAMSEKIKGLIQPRTQKASSLGFASIGLGILHLFFAGVVLL